jgi:cytochrome c-type biogenesis protein CcmH
VDARALYDAQIAEIARDIDRGLMSEADAELARAEAARRLILASKTESDGDDMVGEATYRRRRAASAIILSTVPLVALSLYTAKGSPELPSQPLAARISADPARMDMAVALSRVETHLQLNPTDGRGWEIIAPVYLRAGRYDDAARAFANAAIHLGPTMERLVDVGEARTLAADGVVTAEARQAFDEAAKLAPLNPKGRYYLARALEQDGDRDGALSALRTLLSEAAPDAPWANVVRDRIARIESVPAGGEAIAALPQAQQMEAIRGMVDALAQRLAAQGGTAEDWARLVRSQAALGDRAKAQASLASARTALGGDPGGLLAGIAKDAGLEFKP